MFKTITGNTQAVEEIKVNLFDTIEEGIAEVVVDPTKEGASILKWNIDSLDDSQYIIIETALYYRGQSGLLTGLVLEIDESVTNMCFAIPASSQEKANIILNDIFGTAKVPKESIVTLLQPFAPGMYNVTEMLIIAFNLSEDQLQAINSTATVAGFGQKINKTVRKIKMSTHGSSKVIVGTTKEVAELAGAVGGTLLGGTVVAGFAGGATALDEFTNIVTKEAFTNHHATKSLTNKFKKAFKIGESNAGVVNNKGFKRI